MRANYLLSTFFFLIYLVLDCSPALGNPALKSIRWADVPQSMDADVSTSALILNTLSSQEVRDELGIEISEGQTWRELIYSVPLPKLLNLLKSESPLIPSFDSELRMEIGTMLSEIKGSDKLDQLITFLNDFHPINSWGEEIVRLAPATESGGEINLPSSALRLSLFRNPKFLFDFLGMEYANEDDNAVYYLRRLAGRAYYVNFSSQPSWKNFLLDSWLTLGYSKESIERLFLAKSQMSYPKFPQGMWDAAFIKASDTGFKGLDLSAWLAMVAEEDEAIKVLLDSRMDADEALHTLSALVLGVEKYTHDAFRERFPNKYLSELYEMLMIQAPELGRRFLDSTINGLLTFRPAESSTKGQHNIKPHNIIRRIAKIDKNRKYLAFETRVRARSGIINLVPFGLNFLKNPLYRSFDNNFLYDSEDYSFKYAEPIGDSITKMPSGFLKIIRDLTNEWIKLGLKSPKGNNFGRINQWMNVKEHLKFQLLNPADSMRFHPELVAFFRESDKRKLRSADTEILMYLEFISNYILQNPSLMNSLDTESVPNELSAHHTKEAPAFRVRSLGGILEQTILAQGISIDKLISGKQLLDLLPADKIQNLDFYYSLFGESVARFDSSNSQIVFESSTPQAKLEINSRAILLHIDGSFEDLFYRPVFEDVEFVIAGGSPGIVTRVNGQWQSWTTNQRNKVSPLGRLSNLQILLRFDKAPFDVDRQLIRVETERAGLKESSSYGLIMGTRPRFDL